MNCNYGGCAIDTNSTECQDACNAAPASFCGVCLNNDTCVPVSDSGDCTGSACVLPDSSVDSTLNQV
jgi:hypothetical protein